MTYGGRVFIGGISSNVSKDHIENEFGKFGKLRSVWLASKPPGFAFVEYDDDRDAEEAVKSLNGSNLFNENKIRVEISKKRPGQGGRNPRDGGIKSGGRSNPNFRSANTSFKPKNPRFLNSSSNSRGGGRSIRGGRFSDSSTPRFNSNNQLSDSRPPRQGGNQTQRFQNSRPSGPSGGRFGGSSGQRRPNNGGSSGSGGFFNSGGGSGGYKGGNFRNRQNNDN